MDVPVNYPYEVSNRGRVRRTGAASGTRPGKVLQPEVTNRGYLRVMLQNEGDRQRFHIHRLVARAFLGEPPTDEHEINHKDANKQNNRPENLEWVTRQENLEHQQENDLVLKGRDNGRAKVTEEAVKDIRRLYDTGDWTQAELAEQFGVNQSMVSKIVRRENWKHV